MNAYLEALTPTADDSRRRYIAWVTAFARRMLSREASALDRERIPGIAADAAKLVRLPPITVTEAAQALGIPGSTAAGKLRNSDDSSDRAGFPRRQRPLYSHSRFEQRRAPLVRGDDSLTAGQSEGRSGWRRVS